MRRFWGVSSILRNGSATASGAKPEVAGCVWPLVTHDGRAEVALIAWQGLHRRLHECGLMGSAFDFC
jgi:hypothetical protein